MGLDSYLQRRPTNKKMKILCKIQGKENEELAYWRKSYMLHEKFLSYDKDGGGDLNCKPIPITQDELAEILDWIECCLRDEEGSYTEDDGYNVEADLKLAKKTIKKALKETDFNNQEVYYYAWW